uniref:hypothetical protein n=1 Tax=Amycolatopsis sp. CA-096443 TaxID=3239919 RepID=UPI003F492FB9
MGKRSVRRRKKRITAYMAEHGIGKHTTAARAVDRQRGRAAALAGILEGIGRGGEEKTRAEASFPLTGKARVVELSAPQRRVGRLWLEGAVKGGQLKTPGPVGFATAARRLANSDVTPLIIDTDTTGSGTASLVLSWLVRMARSDDPERIADWLAARHGRRLTAAQRAVLDGLLGAAGLRRDLGRPAPEAEDAEDHALYLRLLDHVVASPRRVNLKAWPWGDERAVMLLNQWEAEHGPLAVDSGDAATSLPPRGNLMYRRVAAVLVSWVVEAAGSDDPQRIAGWLPEFGLVLTAAQQAVLAVLVADPALRVPRDACRAVLAPEMYLQLLGAVLAAPEQGGGGR